MCPRHERARLRTSKLHWYPAELNDACVRVQDASFDEDWQLADADEDGEYVGEYEDDDDEDADEDDGEELTFDAAAGGVGEYWVDAGGDSLAGEGGPFQQQQRPAMLTASGVGLASSFAGRGFMPSMLVRLHAKTLSALHPKHPERSVSARVCTQGSCWGSAMCDSCRTFRLVELACFKRCIRMVVPVPNQLAQSGHVRRY